MKIGVFDSGLGGLTILKVILKKLPQYDYIYLGDNARVPYGGRSRDVIYEFTRQAVDFLFARGCKLVIIACNSATANALKKLQTEYLPKHYPDRKVLGIIKPTIEYLLEHQQERVGIIGTYATVDSGAYLREIHKVLPRAKVWQQSCPLLVPVIEENERDWVGTGMLLDKYLAPIKQKRLETLILACTHYGLIKKQIQAKMGAVTVVIDQGQLVAGKLASYLVKHPEIDRKLTRTRHRTYYVTDLNERFQKIAELFLGQKVDIKKVSL